MNHLRRQKLIEYISDKNGKITVRDNKERKNENQGIRHRIDENQKPNKWDGKWRLVMFDIPMRFTKGREALRFHLKDLDFFHFKNPLGSIRILRG